MFISQQQLKKGVEILKKGGVLVFPTETAYGLGADATNGHAVRKLMAVKGREGWQTPPLIAANREMANKVMQLSKRLSEYAQKFWPGPLTIVSPVQSGSSLCEDVIRDGTVAVRVSGNETARALSEAIGAPIVATSANVAGKPTCYTIADVHAQFKGRLLQPDGFIDAGPLPERAPSTIITEQAGEIVVLRQGEIEISRPYVA